MQQNKAIPAPIFNARKRPRQAMIADPQSSSGQPGPAGAAQYQGLMPSGGFNGGFQQQQQYGPMSGRGDSNRSRPSGSGRGTYQTGPGRQSTGQQMTYNPGQGPRNMNTTHHAGYHNNYQYNQGPMNPIQHQTCTQPHQTISQPDSLYNPPRSYNFSNRGNIAQPQNYAQQQQPAATQFKYAGPISYGAGPGPSGFNYNSGRGRGYTAQQIDRQNQRSFQYNPQATATSSMAAFDDSFEETMNALPSQVINKPTQVINKPTQVINKPTQVINKPTQVIKKPTQPAKSTVKKTQTKDSCDGQRFVTVRAAGVRRWAKHSSNIPLLYEVYGQLDSAIGKNLTDCKEFLLKDDVKDTIKCVFFEIDRPLIKMTRGQHYRVVGTYDQRQDRLKCISVRPTSDSERPLMQMLLDKSSQELAKLTRQAREQ